MVNTLGLVLIVFGIVEGIIAYLMKKRKIVKDLFKDKDDAFKDKFCELCNIEGLIDVAIGSLCIIFSSMTFLVIAWGISLIAFYFIISRKLESNK